MAETNPVENVSTTSTDPPESPGKGPAQTRRDERVRGRLRDVETERDALRGRVDAMVAGEVSRLLGERVRDVEMALRAGGREASDFVDSKTGLVDPEAVASFADEVTKTLPALHRGLPDASGESMHRVQQHEYLGRPRDTWADFLSRRGSTD